MKKKISLVVVVALCIAVNIARADFTFGTPTNLGPTVNSSAKDTVPSISADGLELYFSSNASRPTDWSFTLALIGPVGPVPMIFG